MKQGTWDRHERAMVWAGLAGLIMASAFACGDDKTNATTSSGSTSSGATESTGSTAGSTASGGSTGAACVKDASTAENTAAVVAAANALVATLTSAQQTAIKYDKTLANAEQWSNFPAGVVKRNGVRIGDLSSTAQDAVVALVKVAAGDTGATLFAEIRAADAAFAAIQGGPSALFGDGNYYVSLHGTPVTSSPWMLQVAGHHFVYNFTYNGTCTSATPLFDGAQPAIWTDANGQKADPIAPQRDAMAALFGSVGASAQLSGTFSDMINGPGSLGGGPMGGGGPTGGPMGGGQGGGFMGGSGQGGGFMGGGPTGGQTGTGTAGNGDTKYPSGLTYPTGTTGRGVNAGTLSADQKALLKKVIEAWVKNVAAPVSSALLATYESDEAINETYVGYAGAADLSTTLSYGRIDGPRVWIEFTVQEGTTGTLQGHYHTIWRDKVADYGADYRSP